MANYGSGGSGFGPVPFVVKNLLIINGLVFLAQYVFETQGIQLENWGALWGIGTGNFKVWQLITYQYMHGGIGHIFFNMLTLWMFGSTLENFWGSKRFITFYTICGVCAGIAQIVMQNEGVAIGASGAIMGLMAAYVYLFPNTEMFVMFIPIPLKAKYVIPFFMAYDLFSGISPQMGDNVAHWAHLGGALAGFILVIIWNKTNRKNFY
ncbi:MAG TPA: rhomboid family intramembrane serine protease [Chitinophagaceae bacterium]|jgi:membrane associated rhomboid family serine protease|nr:rhomboid family intramembrane serine protease [Chitinophagaceae bacterium]